MVAFGFCLKILGGGWGAMSSTLSFHECRFSGGNTMRWWGLSNSTKCKRICLNFFHSQVGVGIQTLRVARATW